VPGQLWSAKANLNMSRGHLDEADQDLAKALEAYRRIGDRRREAMMINNTGFLRRLQGRLEEAEDFHLQSLAIREEIGDRVGVGRIHNFLAIIYSSRGEYEKARESTRKALEVARETRDRLFEATALTRLADIEMSQSGLEAAERHFLDAKDIFAEIEDRMRVLQVDVRLAALDLERGNFSRAEEMASQVIVRARAEEIMQPEVEAMELMADVSRQRGDYPVAVSRYGETLDRVRETSWASKESTILQKLAGTFLDVSDLESAEPMIGALMLMEPTPAILMLRARFEFMRGDSALAAGLAREAKAAAVNSWNEDDEATLANYRQAAEGETAK
jgi:tetratricopeptide (TPR) repeat protein